jgi:hypothetical protein
MTKNLQLQETSRLTAAADNAYVRDAIGSVNWERRGLLQRLVRTTSRDGELRALRKGM